MKPFEQLNDAELIALTEDQIQNYIKLKKAETGIRIVAMPETPTYQPIPEPDLEVFEVAGYSFREKEKAEEIAQVINKNISDSVTVSYDWNKSDRHYYAKPFTGSLETVNVKRVYSWPVYDSIKDILTSNGKIQKAYDSLKDEYKAEDEKATEIVENIYEAITKARERIAQFKNYKLRIVEYLQLANGDREVAWNFFDKAYTVEPSVKNMIMESPEYQDAINSYIKA